jgi:hypothetical protein
LIVIRYAEIQPSVWIEKGKRFNVGSSEESDGPKIAQQIKRPPRVQRISTSNKAT